MSSDDVYIIEAVRTPVGVGRESGTLHAVHPVNLLSQVLDAVTSRVDVNKSLVEDIICGVVTPVKEQGSNIPRLSLLKAGYPVSVPAVQINRMCGSGQQAVHMACQGILSGDQEVAIGCGVEVMSTCKMGADSDPDLFQKGEDGKPKLKFGDFPYKLIHQGLSAELIAEHYKISREEMDEFAILSHKRAYEATKNGYFKSQIIPIKSKKLNKDKQEEEVWLTHDEGIRYPVDKQKLGSLKAVFKKDGGVTAGNASQISDGAGAVLVMSGKKADELGLKKRARIVTRVVVGVDPVMMLDGIIPATRKALEKSKLTIDDIDVFETNEAFASVVLSWKKTLNVPIEKINPNGGAIAHGHPLGASGAILMTKLVHELERTNKRYGLQTMCIGHGQAIATIIENCSYKSKL
ncbi:fadA [Acrasis kona]|uniref:FadA n=1 Tax=Acrasis kona TaxID=1008807 RepID=A0AAW2YMY8_9EUKA